MAGVPQVDFALDTYECVVIYPGAAGRALPPETVQRLQAEHAEHMQALQRRGIILVAGSIDGTTNNPEPPIGFGLARTGSVEDVRSVLEADPAVQAGLYRLDVLTFLCPAGSLEFPLAKAQS
ncbi:YciI family protein [Micromonospora sp. RHAY321]|uniref:YciI family protein n=1 Tax=unclassified Micromonospora TaxID=2617518 RepID=UPI00207C5FF0|nr:YciI family protein [Micromonospora sp. RHAY321]MCO1597796.1 YciI family protein [Micromonospora sp. RHAY321]